MATSKIPRPYVTSFLGTDYYQEHIVDNAISFDSNSYMASRVVNGICYVRMHGIILNQVGSNIKIFEGLPAAMITVTPVYIKSQSSDKTLKYIRFIKDGSANNDYVDLIMSTSNMVVGDMISEFSFSYPVK